MTETTVEKRNWFARHKVLSIFLAIFFVAVIATAVNGESDTDSSPATNATSDAKEEVSTPTKDEPKVPAEYRSALNQAKTYANSMDLSKQGVYDQLVSEYGGQFSAEAAQYAVDNVVADWNGNALSQAMTYQNDMNLSPAAVRDQLVSPHGGKFTEAEADFAMSRLNK